MNKMIQFWDYDDEKNNKNPEFWEIKEGRRLMNF